MPKEKVRDYSSLALARRLIFQRGEASRMGDDGRLDDEASEEVSEAIDQALEGLFKSWLRYRAEKQGYPHERDKWDRTKWEKKIVVGMAPKKYHDGYLSRAELQEGSDWNEPNFGE